MMKAFVCVAWSLLRVQTRYKQRSTYSDCTTRGQRRGFCLLLVAEKFLFVYLTSYTTILSSWSVFICTWLLPALFALANSHQCLAIRVHDFLWHFAHFAAQGWLNVL